MTDHVAILEPDNRGRFTLSRWILKNTQYKVFPSEGGVVRLEPV